MNTRLLKGVFIFVVLALNVFAGQTDRSEQWAEVEKAQASGQPQTALEKLEPIIGGAYADMLYAEAIRAIALKMAIEDRIHGNGADRKIVRFQAEVEKAPAAMKPAMEAILAHWYWQYFEQNRWRFMQRTQTSESPGADIQTWDLARILTEIDKHFTAALADETALKKTPIHVYRQLLEPGNVPESYRPTLYDFLAYEALKFYQAGEYSQIKAEDEFEIPADGPVLSDASTFLSWHSTFATKQFPDSPIIKALDLFGRLMVFHADDASRDAYFDADLARLEYGKNVATGDDKIDRYKTALQSFIAATASHGISARATAMLAAQLNSEGEPVKARELAQRGLKAFPSSTGGAMCFNLIQQIEAKSAQLNTESVWNVPWPTLDLTYRNVTKVYFRAIPADFAKRIKLERDEKELLNDKPVLQWEADLPSTSDFKERTEKIPAPTTLKPGYYLIAASYNPSFGNDNNQVSSSFVWVSDLALVLRLRYDSETQSGLVVRAGSGEPVPGAVISIWRENRGEDMKPRFSTVTNDNGYFEFSSGFCLIMAEADGQKVAMAHGINAYGRDQKERADTQTVFFTDRALYRPGQTINYKSVSIRYDREMAKYSVLSGHKLTVVFNDTNGKEIARAEHRTNDYGSFSGTFTAPRDRLMGRMTIQVLGRPSQTSVSVEEYKRPKFQTEIAAPAEAAKLDSPIALTGKATAYNGAAIGGAKVKWHVTRTVQLPRWCWWWQPPATKAIAHGTAVTEPDGTFKIEFRATPDRVVPTKNEPTFVFSVHADVSDTTGETRSAERAVRAGYTALQATLSADGWQTPAQPVGLAISTSSLDGDPQAARGTVTVHALQQPASVVRAPLQPEYSSWRSRSDEPQVDPANPYSWPLGGQIAEKEFSTDASGKTQLDLPLAAGIYRVLLETKDRFGKTVTARQTVEVIDPSQLCYTVKIPNKVAAEKWTVEPGEKFTALWGTGYDKGRAFVEIECNGEILQSYWTVGDRTQDLIKLPVKDAHRGGFTLRVTQVRENRAYTTERIVQVPWTNKQLAVKWEAFRSKLTPGQAETWSAVITGPDAKRTSAEMVAALYDASLDQYQPHQWISNFGVFRFEQNRRRTEFQNGRQYFSGIYRWEPIGQRDIRWQYDSFSRDLTISHHIRYGSLGAQNDGGMDGDVVVLSAFSVTTDKDVGYAASASLSGGRKQMRMGKADRFEDMAPGSLSPSDANSYGGIAAEPAPPEASEQPKPDLSKVTARKNLNETAFFFPHLTADENGVVRMTFTMPEALTEWKFLGFAHDKQLRAGFLTDKVTTSKDLMVEPNPPRFVREGDAIEFTVKVSNQSEQPQKGMVKLTFSDATSLKSVDDALGNRSTEQAFDVPAKQSRSYSWCIAVPDGLGFLTYKAVAATAQFSDGEEGFLPVLSKRVLVTESLPLPIRGKATKKFEFAKLLASGKSDTLRHQSLTVQMTSQPAWYAVMALPYLMEFPHECSEQLFNRFYANALARHIANSDPKIRRVFDLWKATPALDSPLEKNPDLKSLMLEETPWWRDATAESQARRNLGLLFDENRLNDEASRTLKQLAERQQNDGLWAWFPGGSSSEYISRYIVTGFGRLRHLGVEIDVAPALKALAALDTAMAEDYRNILKRDHPEDYVPSHMDVLTLYGRSFFLKDRPIANEDKAAVDFFLRQAEKFWAKSEDRQRLAHLALALQRFGDTETPRAIVKSLKERSLNSEEMGMYWRDAESGWWWYQAPIETQALMIEAFAEVANDAQAVEDCKVWLLKQKQTQNWKTTKATADAVYGLLLRGANLLASDALVEVSLGGEAIKPEKVEAGAGFYEQKFVRGEIKPEMGHVTVKKTDDGVSWGSVHWQYLEDMSKITPHEGTPLKLKKTLWIKETTSKGQVLKPVTGSVAVGDELVVRIELRVDRDMEYVHLKDQRGSGTEPVNVLSRYKWQDGLGYYESTRDTASHFFIDYLQRGTYVFEYSTHVQLKGNYQTGIAEIQCMYAPEFNSHSESILLEVK